MAIQGTADSSLDQLAWDRALHYAYQSDVYFDSWASVRTTNQSMPGATVRFTKAVDLPAETDTLDEKLDVDGQNLTETTLDLTTHEYGAAVTRTRFLAMNSFVPVDPDIARRVGRQAAISQDAIAETAIATGTNVIYSGTGNTQRSHVEKTDELTAANIRRAVARLRRASVPTFGGKYVAAVHPDVSVDLREETGAAAWVEPNSNVFSTAGIQNGWIGTFNGVNFMESPRQTVYEDAGTSSANVYTTYVLGQGAIAKAYPTEIGPRPRTEIGPVVDKLNRFRTVGWYWVGGYGLFRNESLVRIESGSSGEDNV